MPSIQPTAPASPDDGVLGLLTRWGLYHYRPMPANPQPWSTDFEELYILGEWVFRRRHGTRGGHTRLLGGLFYASWSKGATDEYASSRHWSLLKLIALHHVDDEGGTKFANNPGWTWTFASIAPKLNFKRANEYVR